MEMRSNRPNTQIMAFQPLDHILGSFCATLPTATDSTQARRHMDILTKFCHSQLCDLGQIAPRL